jgi:hypothetical protein
MKIRITVGKLSMEAELNDTPTSQKVVAALPLKCSFSTWGDEIYFTIPVTASLDSSAKEVVELATSAIGRQGILHIFRPHTNEQPGENRPRICCEHHRQGSGGLDEIQRGYE